MSEKIKVLYGVPYPKFVSNEFQDVLEKYDMKDLDTGASYPGSEQGIGDAGLPGNYRIHTKSYGYKSGTQGYQGILDSAAESLRRLSTRQVETYLLHTPDPANPISETLDAIQKLLAYRTSSLLKFKKHTTTACQGITSSPLSTKDITTLLGRNAETELFPLLRKLRISYNAYAALAGGFLTKTPEFFTRDATTGTRWDTSTSLGRLYHSIYNRPCLIDGLKMWDEISAKSGIPKAALSYRWVAFNSVLSTKFGDGLIIGAMSSEHLAQVLEWLKEGPLDESVVKQIEKVWETVKGEAAFDNFNT